MSEGTKERKTKARGIRDLGNGWYRIRVTCIDHKTGKQRELDRKIQARGLVEARKAQLVMRDELTQQPAVSAVRVSLRTATASWLLEKTTAKRSDGSTRLTPKTRERYKLAIEKHLGLRPLGDVFLDAVTKRDVEKWRDALGTKYRSATVNGSLRVFKQALSELGKDVARTVSRLPEDDSRITEDEPNALDSVELGKFLAAVRDHWPEHYALILFLVVTTWRVNTAIAVEWTDLDFDRGEARAKRRLSGDEIVPGVKRSRKSVDIAPLTKELSAVLEAHRATFNEKQKSSGLVFPGAAGGYRAKSVLRRCFKDVKKRLGMTKRFTVHGLRRTGCGLYRQAADSVVAKSIAGHITDAMHTHYSVVHGDEKRAAAEKAFGSFIETGEGTGVEVTPNPPS